MQTKRSCFVISPIGQEGSEVREHADDVLDFIIGSAFDDLREQGLEIEATRADHTMEVGRISEQMVRDILSKDFCIAILTYHNPNVFYELAIAFSAARPVIMLVQKGTTIPFDIQDLRIVHYDFRPRFIKERTYSKQISKHIRHLEEIAYKTPVPFGVNLNPLSATSAKLDVFEKAEHFGGSDSWIALIESAKKKFSCVGLSLFFWTRMERFRETILSKAKSGCSIRVLTLAPESPALNVYVNEKGGTYPIKRAQDDVRSAYEFFTKLSEECSNFKFLTLPYGAPHQQIAYTDERMVIIPYLYSRNTYASPLIDTAYRSTLYNVMEHEFETLWSIASSIGRGA